jgi:hypothetical protein
MPKRESHRPIGKPQEKQPGGELRRSPTMSYLLDALLAGEDIGHYGRLTFAIVARHFLEEEELVELLASQPEHDETRARAILLQVKAHGYSPPTRERLLAWQRQQDFPLLPNPEDPNRGNLYRELSFPEGIYEHIGEYWEERASSEAPEPS